MTHDKGSIKVAAHFLISPTTVKGWFHIYQEHGIVGLKKLEKKTMTINEKKSKQTIKINKLRS